MSDIALIFQGITAVAAAASSFVYVKGKVDEKEAVELAQQAQLEREEDSTPIEQQVDDFFNHTLGDKWTPSLVFYHQEKTIPRTTEHVTIHLNEDSVDLVVGDNTYTYHGFPGERILIAECHARILTIDFDRRTGIPEYDFINVSTFVEVTKRELESISNQQLRYMLTSKNYKEIQVVFNGSDVGQVATYNNLRDMFNIEGHEQAYEPAVMSDIILVTYDGEIFSIEQGNDKVNSPWIASSAE